MKAILSMALVLGLCSLAGARDEKADPVGTWKCEYEIGDMKRTAELTIKKDGDKLAGTMTWPDQKDEKLKDVKLKDGTLTYSAVRKFQGNEIPISFMPMFLEAEHAEIKPKRAVHVSNEEYGPGIPPVSNLLLSHCFLLFLRISRKYSSFFLAKSIFRGRCLGIAA